MNQEIATRKKSEETCTSNQQFFDDALKQVSNFPSPFLPRYILESVNPTRSISIL